MFGSLRGIITARYNHHLLIEVNGIGYWVQTGSWQPSGEVKMYLHHHISEKSSDLYGFSDIATLALFEKLLSVTGVGPKAALALLSLGSSDRLEQAIIQHDTSFLGSAPGIGQKAAQKIIVSLDKKLGSRELDLLLTPDQNEVVQALQALGYSLSDIQPLLIKIPDGTLDTQVKWALRELS